MDIFIFGLDELDSSDIIEILDTVDIFDSGVLLMGMVVKLLATVEDILYNSVEIFGLSLDGIDKFCAVDCTAEELTMSVENLTKLLLDDKAASSGIWVSLSDDVGEWVTLSVVLLSCERVTSGERLTLSRNRISLTGDNVIFSFDGVTLPGEKVALSKVIKLLSALVVTDT